MATRVKQTPTADRTRHQELVALLNRQAAALRDQQHSLRNGQPSEVMDVEEYAGYSEEQSVGCSLLAVASQTLHAIEAALERVHTGEAATCTECRRGISRARLRALPFANLCLACQEKHDVAAAAVAVQGTGSHGHVVATRIEPTGQRPVAPEVTFDDSGEDPGRSRQVGRSRQKSLSLLLAGGVVLAVFASSPAAADAQADARRDEFALRDQDRDGALTVHEYGGHPGNFRALDRDHDGALSEDEFVNRHRGGGATPEVPAAAPTDDFTRADDNHDRVLTRDEWQGDLSTWSRLDRDDDGRVDRDEWDHPLDPASARGRFASRDTSQDGALTRAEWVGEISAFGRVDRDRNGRITWDEYRNPPPIDPREQRFGQLDIDHDGVVSRREWRGQPASHHRVDVNGDGVVSLREYMALPDKGGDLREGRFDELDRNDDGVLDRREWPREDAPFEQVDTDRDGGISLQEYLPSPAVGGAPWFDQMDHDEDGVISRREWHGAPAAFDGLDRNDDGVITAYEFGAGLGRNVPREDRFQDADRDRDGTVSRDEWKGDPDAFRAQDRNHDGHLSRYEFDSTFALANLFRYLDGDGDGHIARDEWQGDTRVFARLDRDRDQVLTRDEYVTP